MPYVPPSAARFGAAFLDELLHVAAQEGSLHRPAQCGGRGLEADPVSHERSSIVAFEHVLVPEPAEGSANLFVDKPHRSLQLGDPARHPERNPEMDGAPRLLLAEPDRAGRDSPTARSFDPAIDSR